MMWRLSQRVTYPDIVNYLYLCNPSPFTLDDMRAYKSLEAYNQFVCGWVKELGVVWVKDDTCVLVANVSTPVNQTDKVNRNVTGLFENPAGTEVALTNQHTPAL